MKISASEPIRFRGIFLANKAKNGRSRVPLFIVEKSVVMVYNKLLNFTGVTGNPGKITAGRIRQLC